MNKEKWIKENTGLIIKYALAFGKPNSVYMSDDDFIQEAHLQTVRAIDNYDESKGHFFPYLCSYIKNRIRSLQTRDKYSSPAKTLSTRGANDKKISDFVSDSDYNIKIQNNEIKKILYKGLREHLTQQELKIIKNYFYHKLTLKEIGDSIDLSKERVRQIKKSALDKLRNLFNEYGINSLPKSGLPNSVYSDKVFKKPESYYKGERS